MTKVQCQRVIGYIINADADKKKKDIDGEVNREWYIIGDPQQAAGNPRN